MTRRFIAALALLGACTRSSDRAANLGAGPFASGADPVVLRVPRAGGLVRAYRYPRLDSLMWESSKQAPALGAILAFDEENGALAYLGRDGLPGWIDLRMGDVTAATRTRLTGVASSDAWAIFGIRNDSIVQRLTPSGDWSFKVKEPVRQLLPLPDGSLVLLTQRAGESYLVRLHPPEATLTDSAAVPAPQHVVVGPLGDRIFFAVNRTLLSLGGQSLQKMAEAKFSQDVVSLVPTPSGDRLYLALEGRSEVDVIDRFTNERGTPVRLPGEVAEVRMDPLGRLILARPAKGDSAWIISIASNTFIGTVKSAWRADLPTVAVDGSVATVVGNDVRFIVPGEQRERIIVKDGARDIWYFAFWNGFRPRAKGLDQPVVFPVDSETALHIPAPEVRAPESSVKPLRVDSSALRPIVPRAPVDTPRAQGGRDSWTVSFAAVLSADRAREVAKDIRVGNQQARVVVTVTEGVRVHRVVLGPYPSRAEAERVGQASHRPYWIFEGPP